jgi:hypothetical protein
MSLNKSGGFYFLKIDGSFSVRIPLQRRNMDPILLHFESLEQKYAGTHEFKAKKVRESLGLSKTTVRRLLDWAIENAKIRRLNDSNRDAIYQLNSAGGSKKAAQKISILITDPLLYGPDRH